MNCERVCALLHGYLDGELDLVSAIDLEEHLRGCPNCAEQYEELTGLRAVLSAGRDALIDPAPPELRRRIHQSLRQASRETEQRPRLAWWQAIAGVGALAVLALIFWAVGVPGGWLAPRPETRLAEAVQNAHLRSLEANHLLDVASTDQHTVKPWFDGKLDFSPPVQDFAAQGFPLTGGRLDYIDNHPAAALIYTRSKHVINLFIWPATGEPAGVTSTTINGYNIFHWVQSGMEFWAVSDANAADLKKFVDLVQKSSP